MEESWIASLFPDRWKIIRAIEAGWSDDLKYYVENKKGVPFLLRISNGSDLAENKLEDQALQSLSTQQLRVSKLLELGECNGDKNSYRIFSWIEGEEFLKSIHNYSDAEQYQYGLDSGRLLRAIHKIKSPPGRIAWSEYYSKKIDRKIASYKNCGVNVNKANLVLDYIKTNRGLLQNRPETFQHGDYHLGNMLITPRQELAVIDFNRLDFGDPWQEFNRIVWSASKSLWFASGQINGYFEGKIPSDFFQLLALYICVNQIGAIPWAIPYGQAQLKIMVDQLAEVLGWYEDFQRVVPRWYRLEMS